MTLLSNDEKVGFFAVEPLPPPIEYHSWEAKYDQVFIREKIKKSMTKDSYTQTTRLIAYANEFITTEEECEPLLISADAVRIRKPVIRREPKPICKFRCLFSFTFKIRYIFQYQLLFVTYEVIIPSQLNEFYQKFQRKNLRFLNYKLKRKNL